MLGDDRLELSDELAVAPELEVGVDPRRERAQPQLLEAGDLRLGELLVGEVRERGPAPERERRTKALRAYGRLGASCLRDQPLEDREVQLLRLDR